MLNIYFIRHGQTIFNLNDRVQGWCDSPLTDLGKDQARYAGYGARHLEFSAAYSGDCPRQIETAKIFLKENDHPIPVIPDQLFREMNYGKYEYGSYRSMLEPLFLANRTSYGGYDKLYHYYNDIQIAEMLCRNDETKETEGIERAWERFSRGLDMIASTYQEGNVLVSTSSLIIGITMYKLFPNLKQDGLVANCSLTRLGFDGNYHLLVYNDISYREAGQKHFENS